MACVCTICNCEIVVEIVGGSGRALHPLSSPSFGPGEMEGRVDCVRRTSEGHAQRGGTMGGRSTGRVGVVDKASRPNLPLTNTLPPDGLLLGIRSPMTSYYHWQPQLPQSHSPPLKVVLPLRHKYHTSISSTARTKTNHALSAISLRFHTVVR